jgi:hypothetical protein
MAVQQARQKNVLGACIRRRLGGRVQRTRRAYAQGPRHAERCSAKQEFTSTHRALLD